MNELKPCPFCGSKAKLEVWFDEMDELFAIKCQKCAAMSDSWDRPRKENAITEWNTRTDPVKAQMLEALEEAEVYSVSGIVDQDKMIKILDKIEKAIEAAEKEEIK